MSALGQKQTCAVQTTVSEGDIAMQSIAGGAIIARLAALQRRQQANGPYIAPASP